jgi:uncharacterized protein
MPLQLTYPGVYVQELPSGTHTIAGAATSVTAFVGYLTRGPLNTPVRCLNFGDFQRAFGGLDPNSVTSFQVSQFFLNGGVEAWVSRLYASSTPPVQPSAQLTLSKLSGTGSSTLLLQSSNPGTWGSNIFVTVDYMTNKSNMFNLTVALYSIISNSSSASKSFNILQTLSIPGVTLDRSKANSLDKVMQSVAGPNAQLLAIPNINDTFSSFIPTASGTLLTVTQPVPSANLTFTIKVTPPSPTAPSSVTCNTVFSVHTVADLVAGIQSALSSVAGEFVAKNAIPSLAGAVVRSCLSPFPPALNKPQAQLVQIWSPDPALAQYKIDVTASGGAVFATLQSNVQAQQLAFTPPNTPSPDGLIPTGSDVAGNSTKRTGIYALDGMQIVNLLLVPDMPAMVSGDYLTAATATLNYAIQREAFAILDLPASIATPSDAVDWATNNPGTFGSGIVSAATYFPQVLVPNPFSALPMKIGGGGTLAGVYALTDQTRGVWKAPAGISAPLAGVQKLSYAMNDQENGQINLLGVNALRTFPIYDNISWGSRTLASANIADEDWKYVPVRRLALYIEQSLIQGLQWVVFEPNDERLWTQIRLSVNSFLHPLYLQGAFVGTTPSQAYQCICNASTTTAQDMENGIVNIVILFAPVRPAEFVVISLQQMAGQSSS